MTEKLNPDGLLATHKKYAPVFKDECVRQVAAEYEGLKAYYAAHLQAHEGMKYYAKSLLRNEY